MQLMQNRLGLTSPAVRHVFTGDSRGCFSNAVYWTKCHLTRSVVSVLEWSSRPCHVWRR